MPDVYRSKVKVNGTWYTVSATYVKVAGTWNLATGVKTKVDGAWQTVYPYPLSADVSLTNLAVNGTTVANGGTYNAPKGTTSVNITATLPAGATATGLGTVSVSYAGNPNTKSIVVTAENGTTTATYSVNIAVAAPPTVTIYYKYCNASSVVSGSFTDTNTTNAATACNNRQAALGYPPNWVCGSSTPANPTCVTTCTPCCQDTGSFTCIGAGPNRVQYTYYQYDPCCGTSCPNRYVYEDTNICFGE